jgi:hypothetical protein
MRLVTICPSWRDETVDRVDVDRAAAVRVVRAPAVAGRPAAPTGGMP